MEWKDPPTNHANSSDDWQSVADELKAHPNQWALIRHYDGREGRDRAAAISHRIRHGLSKSWRPRFAFEARSNMGDIYARFIGEQDTP